MDRARRAQAFSAFAVESRSRSPLYGRLAETVATDVSIASVLDDAPTEQQIPVLLFAAVHHLLLSDPQAPLARYYPSLGGTASGDPAPAFTEFCREHEAELRRLAATRRVQTNEIGRAALLVPALALVERDTGPLALVDVGTSAGLNLQLDRFRYRYSERDGSSHREIGGPSNVMLDCGTRGAPPLPEALPLIARRIGLDRAPIDVGDEESARWLQACVWPDQPERLARLRAAIDLARAKPERLVAADAVDGVTPLLEEVAAHAHPVVVNTWVLSYLPPERRIAYVERLDDFGLSHDLSWIYAEAPASTAGLPTPRAPTDATNPGLTALVVVRWTHGRRYVERLATCHPHGFWLHWLG